MTEAAASKALDVPPKVLANMADAGLVEADYGWVKDVLKGGPIRVSAVEQVQAKLLANVAAAAARGLRDCYWKMLYGAVLCRIGGCIRRIRDCMGRRRNQ